MKELTLDATVENISTVTAFVDENRLSHESTDADRYRYR